MEVLINDKWIKKTNVYSFETYGILWRLWNLWYFTEVLKLIVFYKGFETHGILQRF